MKTIKIIDLYNLIANEDFDKLPKKFTYKGYLWEYDVKNKMWFYYFGENKNHRFDRLFYINQILNDEIEILEDEKKIPKKLDKKDFLNNQNIEQIDADLDFIIDKINEILDYLESRGLKMLKKVEHCYCDRCKREIKKGETVNYRYYPDLRYELCDDCNKIFEEEEMEYRKLKIEHERMEKEYQLEEYLSDEDEELEIYQMVIKVTLNYKNNIFKKVEYFFNRIAFDESSTDILLHPGKHLNEYLSVMSMSKADKLLKKYEKDKDKE